MRSRKISNAVNSTETLHACAVFANGKFISFFEDFYLDFFNSVRKNRETAILSQKRKREKIEELDRVTEMYNQLQNQVRIILGLFFKIIILAQ